MVVNERPSVFESYLRTVLTESDYVIDISDLPEQGTPTSRPKTRFCRIFHVKIPQPTEATSAKIPQPAEASSAKKPNNRKKAKLTTARKGAAANATTADVLKRSADKRSSEKSKKKSTEAP